MFKVEKVTNDIVTFIRDYYKKNNLGGAIIGISGGKDSAVVAGLFTKALGKDNVVGIWMPCHSKESDKKDACKVADCLGIELLEHDLTDIYDNYVSLVKKNNEARDDYLVDANINIKPRFRMATLYYYAAFLSKKYNKTFIVPGTSNKCELYVGYFTKGGDNVSDIQVLADLCVSEVIEVGKYLSLPQDIVEKTPDDGLSGISDEEKLGVRYSDIEKYLNNQKIDKKKEEKIVLLHKRNMHKFNIPIYYKGNDYNE